MTLKLQQLPSLTNKYDEGFLLLDGIKASSLLSQSDRQKKLCSCQNTWVTLSLPTPAPPPQALSDSGTLTSAVLDAEHPPPPPHPLNSLSGGHVMETELHAFTPSKQHLHVLWHVIENHDLV